MMKVLYASSEATPFVKTGGLGDVAGSLPAALCEKGVDARVIMPLYRCIPQQYKDKMVYLNHIYIDMAWRKQYCGVFSMDYNGTTFYFVDNEYYFNGDKPYDYIHLDCEKFIFFSKAVLSLLPTIDFRPDVINCNDWQTGAIPVFLDTFQDNPFYRGIKTVMTVHNLKFQGRWDFKKIKDVMGISDYYFTSDKLEYYKDANLLKGGMVYANKISTVSNSYANEITTEQYGEGLSGLLSARRGDLIGIVNGISYNEWNPETDPMIFKSYSKKTVAKYKKMNKTALQQQLNLPVDENKFMIGIVSRLTDQKGFDLVAGALEQLCAGGCQIVILGTGDEAYENLFRHYDWKYPDRVSAQIYFSNELSHKIYAACDAFLMPSLFEPCGLSQLISMRYGTLPIVRETGGLKDTVEPYNEFTGEGCGFSFKNYNVNDMMYVINYAMDIYYNRRDAWEGIIANAMNRDFSWSVSADKYIEMYRQLTGIYEEAPVKTPTKPVAKKPAAKKKSTFDADIKADAEKASETLVKQSVKAETAPNKTAIADNVAKLKAEIEAEEKIKSAARGNTAKKPAQKKPAAKKTTAKSSVAKKKEKK